jgi:hypothetical protein
MHILGDHTVDFHTPKSVIVRAMSSLQSAQTWADSVVSGIVLSNNDQKTPSDSVLISHTSPQLPSKKEAFHTEFANDHWALGVPLPKPSIASLLSTNTYMANIPSEEIDRCTIYNLSFSNN